MRLPTITITTLIVLCLTATAYAGDPRCAGIGTHPRDTVIALTAAGQFTICRNGEVQEDVIAGRPVWLELQPDSGDSVYEYRIAERNEEPAVSGLVVWHERAEALARSLSTLASSAASIGELPPPHATEARQRGLQTARALYLGVVTPRFTEALRELPADASELPTIAARVRRWCNHLSAEHDAQTELAGELSAACSNPALEGASVRREVDALEAAVRTFHARRSTAREALVSAEALPDDAARQQEAEHALDAARAAAHEILTRAEALRPMVVELARDATILRQAVHSGGVLRPGVPVTLARYGHAGNGILRIEARPVGIIAAGVKEARADTHMLTFRFTIVDTHYVDLEVGLGLAEGLPQVPTLGTTNGMTTIQGKQPDEFVALAMVELEPLRFAYPDKAWAGLLRLPVLAIPLSQNPTEHFYIGGGLGWTGVGSISVGPTLVRELSLRSGYSVGEPLPAGSSFSGITHPAVQVGWFVSASVDLLGLFHLFVPVHVKSIDASTGNEL